MDMMCSSRLFAGTAIVDVDFRRLQPNQDERGCFTEVFQNSWESISMPCQWSVVNSQRNVFRGCHFHLRHDEYFTVLSGRASVGLRDERPDSPTRGAWSLYELHGDDPYALMFPSGVVHGWYFHSDSVHLQAVTESYETYNSTDNFGVNWADPELEIPWPFKHPNLSPRASEFPSLSDLRNTLANVQVK